MGTLRVLVVLAFVVVALCITVVFIQAPSTKRFAPTAALPTAGFSSPTPSRAAVRPSSPAARKQRCNYKVAARQGVCPFSTPYDGGKDKFACAGKPNIRRPASTLCFADVGNESFWNRVAGRTVWLVGDSLMYQTYVALSCHFWRHISRVDKLPQTLRTIHRRLPLRSTIVQVPCTVVGDANSDPLVTICLVQSNYAKNKRKSNFAKNKRNDSGWAKDQQCSPEIVAILGTVDRVGVAEPQDVVLLNLGNKCS